MSFSFCLKIIQPVGTITKLLISRLPTSAFKAIKSLLAAQLNVAKSNLMILIFFQ